MESIKSKLKDRHKREFQNRTLLPEGPASDVKEIAFVSVKHPCGNYRCDRVLKIEVLLEKCHKFHLPRMDENGLPLSEDDMPTI